MHILLLENDDLQVEQIEADIKARFGPDVTVERIATEYDFRQWLNAADQSMPDIAILDVMVSWTDPAPEIPEPPREVSEQGHYRAGLRCANLLAKKAPQIPIILYTVLEKNDLARELRSLPPHVLFLSKEGNGRPLNE